MDRAKGSLRVRRRGRVLGRATNAPYPRTPRACARRRWVRAAHAHEGPQLHRVARAGTCMSAHSRPSISASPCGSARRRSTRRSAATLSGARSSSACGRRCSGSWAIRCSLRNAQFAPGSLGAAYRPYADKPRSSPLAGARNASAGTLAYVGTDTQDRRRWCGAGGSRRRLDSRDRAYFRVIAETIVAAKAASRHAA
jgi:hypothetical protein